MLILHAVQLEVWQGGSAGSSRQGVERHGEWGDQSHQGDEADAYLP